MSQILDKLKKFGTTEKGTAPGTVPAERVSGQASDIQKKLSATYFEPKKSQNFDQFIQRYNRLEAIKLTVLGSIFVFFLTGLAYIVFSGNKFDLQVNISQAPSELTKLASITDSAQLPLIDLRDLFLSGEIISVGDFQKEFAAFQYKQEGGEAKGAYMFENPVDLSEAQTKFSLKGLSGGESAKIYFKDSKGNLLFARLSSLDSAWRKFSIKIINPDDAFDNTLVREIGFDIGADDLANTEGTIIFLKELRLEKLNL